MFPNRSKEIEVHRENARRLAQQGENAQARASYTKWVESLRQQNVNSAGTLEDELKAAQAEYSEWVKTDLFYRSICEMTFPIIRESPGILQTELYKKQPHLQKEDISWALYFASEHGTIVRGKRGRTYALWLKKCQ